MPDICMCVGNECPLKENCYRFTAEPSYMQAYFTDPPIKDGECEYYWPLKTQNNDRNDIQETT